MGVRGGNIRSQLEGAIIEFAASLWNEVLPANK